MNTTESGQPPSVPWNIKETWLGLLLMVFVILGSAVFAALLPPGGLLQSLALVLTELFLLLPVAIILARRRISWRHLGFRPFAWDGLALGCGLVLVIYPLILLHNLLLVELGIETQGDSILELYRELGAPAALLVAGILLAPIVEEIFFRGFLFPGLRERYGWVRAMLLSAAIFAGFHLQWVALIPTFLLGCMLAYLRQRTDSLWPGIFLHFTINGVALCAAAAAVQFGWTYGVP